MMGFGILPGCGSLNIPCFQVGTNDEVYATMDILDSTRKGSPELTDINRCFVGKWDAHCMYGVRISSPLLRI